MAKPIKDRKEKTRSGQRVSLAERAVQAAKSVWRHKLPVLLAMLAAAAAVSMCSVQASKNNASASLVLLYEQAYEGLNPNGTRFNIYELLDDEVLAQTIDMAGLDGELSKDDLLDSMKVRASGSQNVEDMYIATEYSISLSGDKLPKRVSADSVLNLLMETYRQFFLKNYGTNDSILDIDWSCADNWEYLDFASMVDIKANDLIAYLDWLRTESGMAQYRVSGESFRSLSESIASFRDIYLNRFTSYIMTNRLFRDSAVYRNTLEYQHFLTEQSLNNSQNLFQISQDALTMYDESMITFVMVPMYDSVSGLYMARTAIGMDSLTDRSRNYVEALDTSSKELKELNRKIEGTMNEETDQEKHDAAERMIVEIRQHMDDLIGRIRSVKKEYEDYRSGSLIRYSLNQPGIVSAYNLKGAAAAAIAVLALFAVFFAAKTHSKQEQAI